MYSSTATFPSKCGTRSFPPEAAADDGKVDQTRCSSVGIVAAASTILRPWVISSASASAAVSDVKKGTQKSVTACALEGGDQGIFVIDFSFDDLDTPFC